MIQFESELSLDIASAKIQTEKGAAIDSFHVRELEGDKILGPARQHEIEHRLRAAIASLDAPLTRVPAPKAHVHVAD